MTECCSRETEAVYCLVMGWELSTPITCAQCRVRAKPRVTDSRCTHQCVTPWHTADGELQICELLDFINHFSAICSPTRTRWWWWNESPGKKHTSCHATQQSLNLHTWTHLALQTFIGIPCPLTRTVRAADFTWYTLFYWHFEGEPCLPKLTSTAESIYLYLRDRWAT